jgi:hypothetical protein
MPTGGFYLGGLVSPDTGERTEERISYEPADLTTHGVIVGMTGSGKTGLGIIYLEESLLAGIPTLILDPKGDMTNLLLTFPDLAAADFEPWVDPTEAARAGVPVEELAAAKAEQWRDGLAAWGEDGATIRRLRDAAGFTIYTPGSGAGVPLNFIGSLANPGGSWDREAEALRDEIEGLTTGLLGLVGIAADPISSREHILIANIVERTWRAGRDLDMAGLLGAIQDPPFRKLGVLDLDTFYPKQDRLELAMQLNGLVASPAFAAWTEGPAVDIAQLLHRDGKPQAAIVYLAHLSEEERQFVVALLLSKVVTWMRAQSGTTDLRALVYMDEVYGFAPPTATPPAKKPILTLLKQARAYGVGLLLSTQNPVDLDYKAMSNAGTWCIGRLQTERDKARIIEALRSARGDTDIAALDASISQLDKRQFLLHNTREDRPVRFTTRWALSYLRGPLTKEQIGTLMAAEKEGRNPPASPPAPPPATAGPAAALAPDETPVMPQAAAGVAVRFPAGDAPWLATLGLDATATRHTAGVAARVRLTFDDRYADLVHHEEWEALVRPLRERLDPDAVIALDYDERDLIADVPEGATFVIPQAPIEDRSFWRTMATDLKEMLYRDRTITILKNPELKLYSRIGETRADFAARCDAVAQEHADAAAAKQRGKYETRIKRATSGLASAERRADQLAADVAGARRDEIVSGAGAIINILLGRKSTRAVTGSARSRSNTRSKETRLRNAEAAAGEKQAEIDDLETELIAELEQINDEWEERGAAIEELEIGLEKSDIEVVDTTLVWLPGG